MLTPEDITKALTIAKHCLTDDDLFGRIAFDMNPEEKDLVELKEKLQKYLA